MFQALKNVFSLSHRRSKGRTVDNLNDSQNKKSVLDEKVVKDTECVSLFDVAKNVENCGSVENNEHISEENFASDVEYTKGNLNTQNARNTPNVQNAQDVQSEQNVQDAENGQGVQDVQNGVDTVSGDGEGNGKKSKKTRTKNIAKEIKNDTLYAAKLLGKGLSSKVKEAVISVLPVSVIVVILALTLCKGFVKSEIVAFCICAVLLIIGIAVFNLGADLAMTPMGEKVGAGLTKSRKLWLLLSVAFVMGLLITVAEPDLAVLAEQVRAVVNNKVLMITVGVGVGLFLVFAIARVVFKKTLAPMLMFFYMAVFMVCAILIEQGKSGYVPLIFDSGGVTTGPVTVPFIMALGIGVASTIGGRKEKENSFGLVAMCSIGPMLAVAVLMLASKGSVSYAVPDYTFESAIGNIGGLIAETVKEVSIALGLIVVFFTVLQIAVLKLPKKKLAQIVIGIFYTFAGLVIFLTAVKVGFMPMGFKLGTLLAENSKYILIVFAFVLGFVVVLAEPAVHVLNQQVEEITGGAVSKKAMLVALSLGVGISIGLSVIRLIYGFSLLYYLIPGYALSLGLSFFVPKLYTAIAFDSGGVASGPLTSSFILPMAIGACVALRGEAQVMDFAFGIVAMVAMTPLITIQLLGFRAVASAKVQEKIELKRIVDADDEQIIDFM